MRGRESVWNDPSLPWTYDGPDPRWTYTLTVHSSRVQQDIKDDGMVYEDEEVYDAKDMAAALVWYSMCTLDPSMKHCDVRLRLSFGGLYEPYREVGEPYIPRIGDTYIYLVRWRADGAFLESYHVNETKFAEREPERNELTKIKAPGLMSHYK